MLVVAVAVQEIFSLSFKWRDCCHFWLLPSVDSGLVAHLASERAAVDSPTIIVAITVNATAVITIGTPFRL